MSRTAANRSILLLAIHVMSPWQKFEGMCFELVKFRFLLGFTLLLCGLHLVHCAGSTGQVRL